MRTAAAFAFVGVLLLAGCASKPAPVASAPEDSSAALAPAFSLHGCAGTVFSFFMDDGPVRAAMPPGYRPFMVQGAAVATVDLETYLCDSVTVDDVAYSAVPLALVRVPVHAPTLETGVDAYVFEWLFPVDKAPELAAWLVGHGWPVQDAVTVVTDGLVTVQGKDVDYRVVDAGEAGGVEPVPASWTGTKARLHHESAEHGHSILNQNYTMAQPSGASSPELVARNGALSKFAAGASGTAAAGIASNHLVLDADFDDRPAPGDIPS